MHKKLTLQLLSSIFMILMSCASYAQMNISLSLTSPIQPVQFPANGNIQTLSFNVENTGSSTPTDGMQLIFLLDPAIQPATANSSDPGWSCLTSTSLVTCDYSLALGIDSLTTVDLQISSTTFPIALSSAITADLFEVSGAEVAPETDDNNVLVGMEFIAAAADADVSITKSIVSGFNSDVVAGDPLHFNLLVQHLSGVAATNVVVTDDILGPQLIFDLDASSPECIDTGSVIQCSISSLNPGSSFNFVIATTVNNLATPGQQNNIVDVTINENDTNPGNNTASVLFDIFPIIDLEVLKTIQGGATSIVQGGQVVYEIQITNLTNDPGLPGVVLEDILPSEVNFNSVNTSSNLINCMESANVVVCDTTAAFPGLTSESIFITADVIGNVGNNVVNMAGLIIAPGDSAPGNNSDIASFIIDAPAGVEIDLNKTIFNNLTEMSVGGTIEYIIEVNNTSGSNATNVVFTDTLPPGVMYQSHESGGPNFLCNFVDPTLTCTATTLPPTVAFDGAKIFVTVTGNVGETITNVASTTFVDSNAGDNTSSVDFLIANVDADLDVSKTSDVVSYFVGDEIIYTIVVNNPPASTGSPTDVTITDTLPPEVSFNVTELSAAPGWVCNHDGSANGGVLSCGSSGNSLNPGSSISIIIRANAITANASVLNTVTVASSLDSNLTNNSSSASVIVLSVESGVADMAVQIEADLQDIRQGSAILLDVVTDNLGPDVGQNANLSATFSGLIESINVLNSGNWNCAITQSTLSCNYPGDYPANLNQRVQLEILTQRVEQTAENFSLTVDIVSDTTDIRLDNNNATVNSNINPTPSEDDIFNRFNQAIGSDASPQVRRAIRNVSSYCARRFFNALEGLCENLIEEATNGSGSNVVRIMEQLTPDELIGQSASAAEIITSQFRNIDARLSALRGGGGGSSLAGLTARYGDQSIPLGMLSYVNQSEDEQASGVNSVDDFISPWGFFMNGTISMGERDATGRELGFDFNTYGLTAGFDYRFSHKTVLGLALGYASFDSKVDNSIAQIKSTGITLTGYGSFSVSDNFYMDARISYGRPDFDQSRSVNFTVGSTTIDRIATSQTNADQYTVAMSFGYNFYKNTWNITPNASLRYVRTNIDSFVEQGAGAFNFDFSGQQIDSMVFSAGMNLSKAISLKNSVITPQFDIKFNRETKNDGGFIEARFIMAPEDEIFLIETDDPDRTYGSAGAGLVFIGANGKQAYINYRSIFGLEGFSRGTINFGARFEF